MEKEQIGKITVLQISPAGSWMYNMEPGRRNYFQQLCMHTQASAGPWPRARLQPPMSVAGHAAFRLLLWISDTRRQQNVD